MKKKNRGYLLIELVVSSFIFLSLLLLANGYINSFHKIYVNTSFEYVMQNNIFENILYSIHNRDRQSISIWEDRIRYTIDGKVVKIYFKDHALYIDGKKLFKAEKIQFSKERGLLKIYIENKGKVSEKVLKL